MEKTEKTEREVRAEARDAARRRADDGQVSYRARRRYTATAAAAANDEESSQSTSQRVEAAEDTQDFSLHLSETECDGDV